MEYNRIYVAVDGSQQAEMALAKAIAVSKRNNNAKVHAVHVVDKSTRAHLAEHVNQLYLQELQDHATKIREIYEQELQEAGVPYEFIRLEGSPKSELIKLFKTLDEHDLVICGATGISNSIDRMLFGSVSDGIVRHSACDVLVVRTRE